MRKPSPLRHTRPATSPSPPNEPRTVASETLLQGARELHITHRGKRYRLLETRAGKLLLNG